MENALRLREAQQVHAQIMANGRLIGQALVDMAALLKRMRDERLYEEMGRTSFEEYLKEDVGLGVRQAYNYISTYERLQPELLEKYSGAGITKLQLLCEVSAPEREEFAESADLANITVAELEKLVEEKNGLHEQLSFLTEERREEAEADARLKAETAEKLKKLEEEVKALRSAPVEVEVREVVKEDPAAAQRIKELEARLSEEALRSKRRLEEVKTEANAKLKAEKEAGAKALEKERAAMQAKLQEAGEAARAEALKELEADRAAAAAEAEELKKKLAAAGSKETAEFGVLLKKVQTDLARMKEIRDSMADEAKKDMLSRALEALKGIL